MRDIWWSGDEEGGGISRTAVMERVRASVLMEGRRIEMERVSVATARAWECGAKESAHTPWREEGGVMVVERDWVARVRVGEEGEAMAVYGCEIASVAWDGVGVVGGIGTGLKVGSESVRVWRVGGVVGMYTAVEGWVGFEAVISGVVVGGVGVGGVDGDQVWEWDPGVVSGV